MCRGKLLCLRPVYLRRTPYVHTKGVCGTHVPAAAFAFVGIHGGNRTAVERLGLAVRTSLPSGY